MNPLLPTHPISPGFQTVAFTRYPYRCAQILNLVVNAAHAISDVVGDHTGLKGRIIIRTGMIGESAVIRVEDTGGGIPEGIQHRIFDPFFTTKTVGQGTGQGLAIARSVIVDRHGGTLTFETRIGEGTTFIITLPTGKSLEGEPCQ